MKSLSDAVHRLWQTLSRNDLLAPSDHTLAPLLDSKTIADLRQRSLGVIDHKTKNKSVLHREHGEYVSPRRGYGLDYEESRVYQPGDDLRFMNWRLTARSGEPYIKVFREERRPSAFILLDRRNGMRFGTRLRLKVTQALRVAILLAFYEHNCGRSLSGVVIDGELHWLAAGSDEQSTLGMIDTMNQACPPPSDIQQPDFKSMLRAIHSAVIPGTRLYLISDFIDATNDCHGLLAQLVAEHEVNAIHIVDPAEQQLPKAGKLRLVDVATDDTRRVDTSDPQITTQYRQAARQHFADRESLIRGLGMGYVRLSTTIDNIESQMAFL
ncbi:MAG: DUF58 domain-containing protein [Gammaproteobacteria bacterium]|jgi:uncharacterized protein (DUF58 family)